MKRRVLKQEIMHSLGSDAVGNRSIPSLDGLRAVSVGLVVVAHAGYGAIVPGGLGVTIFFFLSGYLITTLLLGEHRQSGAIDLKAFYIRRFLRLSPALYITLAIAYLLVAIGWLGGGMSTGGLSAQVLYFTNYFILFFDPLLQQIPGGTSILWSLSVEEHFYLLFPLALVCALRMRRPMSFLPIGIAVVCLAILIWRCVLIIWFEVDALRTYYATDTRIDAILFGCLLASISNSRLALASQFNRERLLYALFLCGVAGIIATLLIRNTAFRETLRYTLQGLFLIPIFVYLILRPQTAYGRILNSEILKEIGRRSYTIYLSHYLVADCLIHFFPSIADKKLTLLLTICFWTYVYAAVVDGVTDRYLSAIRRRFHRAGPLLP